MQLYSVTLLSTLLLLPGLLALQLHPGGALVPEDTPEVQEARHLHEAALEAAEQYAGEGSHQLSADDTADQEKKGREKCCTSMAAQRMCPCFTAN